MGQQRISCHVRCLEGVDVFGAWKGLATAAQVSVPYTCKLSGKREALLLSDDCAKRLADRFRPLGKPESLKMLAALASAELCECDVATLLQKEEGVTARELQRLYRLGLLKHRHVEGINYHALANEALSDLLKQGPTSAVSD
jgi:DNA-binding transcriptional ArsR family regulator